MDGSISGWIRLGYDLKECHDTISLNSVILTLLLSLNHLLNSLHQTTKNISSPWLKVNFEAWHNKTVSHYPRLKGRFVARWTQKFSGQCSMHHFVLDILACNFLLSNFCGLICNTSTSTILQPSSKSTVFKKYRKITKYQKNLLKSFTWVNLTSYFSPLYILYYSILYSISYYII